MHRLEIFLKRITIRRVPTQRRAVKPPGATFKWYENKSPAIISMMLMIIAKITVFLKPGLNCNAEATGRAIIDVSTNIPTIFRAVETAAATKIEKM